MAQIAELQDCLAVISGKVATYQQHVAGEILFRQQDGRWLLRC